MKAIAVDWSGAKAAEGARGIAVATAAGGGLESLVTGIGRSEAIDLVIAEAARSEVIVGFDFSFSLPAWFLEQRGLDEAPELWELAAVEGERWLEMCEPPFWGRPGRQRPPDDPARPQLRETDVLTIAESALGPRQARSPFQVSGAGSVGASTVRGLPHLLTLRQAGFAIWPWDRPRTPVAIEIWTRVAIGDTVKSDPGGRAEAVALDRRIPPGLAEAAADSEDSFDSAISALWLLEHSAAILSRPPLGRPSDRLEGRTWIPDPTPRA